MHKRSLTRMSRPARLRQTTTDLTLDKRSDASALIPSTHTNAARIQQQFWLQILANLAWNG